MADKSAKSLVTAAARVLVCAAAFIVIASTGCSRCSGDRTNDIADTLTTEQMAEINLASKPVFDREDISGMANAIRGEARFDAADLSKMLVLCDAAVIRLQTEADQLLRNEDAADSFNVLSEFASSPWTADVRTIYDFLSHADTPLNDAQRQRRISLTRSITRLNETVSEIENSQLGGRRIFRL